MHRPLLVIIFVMSALASPPAYSRNFSDRCPRYSYLVGLQVRSGAWLDAVIPLCAPLSHTGVLGTPRPLSSHGGTGGSVRSPRLCPASQFVGRIRQGYVRRPSLALDFIELTCFLPGHAPDQTVCVETGDGCWRGRGPNSPPPGASFRAGAPDESCPAGHAAVGIHGVVYDYVSWVHLLCAPVERPPPPRRLGRPGPPSPPDPAWEEAKKNFDVLPIHNRPGGDYRNFQVGSGLADVAGCANTCLRDDRCMSWVYLRATYNNGAARCYLKSTIPAATRTMCCYTGARKFARIKSDVDVYDVPGGGGNRIGILRQDQKVPYGGCRADNWCRITGVGWIFGTFLEL